ncbi:hypothetical protein BD410DRAFT_824454 [Rickenella mellea]|uniref:Mediator of RNA polymerase II transcription subunit 9 n=1 Tax=Rickenella mellea TaxID=50990 RepID=A0A4Y7QN75_9AGAM|nr:hypothetical protein BD410DRAFT_824454 [Rickenella mellea]
MSSNALPTAAFDGLIENLAHVLEVTQNSQPQSHEARLALFLATTAFKDGITQAKDLATALPGGELLIEEQNQVIAMLEELRDRKRQQLAELSMCALSTSSGQSTQDMKMEIDSTASSPHD